VKLVSEVSTPIDVHSTELPETASVRMTGGSVNRPTGSVTVVVPFQ